MGFFDLFRKKYTVISAQEAQKMMAESNGYVLLDVRMEPEYKQERIDGAKLIPVDELKSRASAELPDKQARIFIYCRSGMRATRAAEMLTNKGYTNVFTFGGITNWPYETVKG